MRGLDEREKEALDLANLESHLSADDFQAVFGKTKAEFERMAGWKKVHEKKAAYLF